MEKASEAVSNFTQTQLPKQSLAPLLLPYHAKKTPKIWAVGGGKGGVGKSLICANFSWLLAKEGKHVAAIDLDLGGSNLHTCLGVQPPKIGLGDWVSKDGEISLEQVCSPTHLPSLVLISGSTDPISVIPKMENLKKKLFESIYALNVDDVIIDLGAGTHPLTVEFFNQANDGLLSILPEPTSVENAYRFIRVAFYQKILSAPLSPEIRQVVEVASQPKNQLGIRVPADLIEIVEELNPEEAKLIQNKIKEFKPHIIINQVRTPQDIEIGKSICSVCRRFYGIDAKFSGYIDYDNAVWKAVRAKKPAVDEFPRSILSARIKRMTQTLLDSEKAKETL